jgi:predicted XRE-type DNA-binding protein
MIALQEYLHARGWPADVAAERCDMTVTRLNELLKGRIGCFDLEALVAMATSLGLKMHLAVTAPEVASD